MSQAQAIKLDSYIKQQLENRDIPIGEILREKGFVTLEQIEEALEKSQKDNIPMGLAVLELGFINQTQLKIALEDQAAIKKFQKKRVSNKRKLGDILLASGALTQEQLSAALEFSAAHGMRIGDALVQLGIVTEDELAQSVAEQLMIPYIKLAKTPPDPLVIPKIQGKMAFKHQVIPVKQEGTNLFLAMVDPQNILVVDDIEKSTGMKVIPMIVATKDFLASYEAFYGDAAQAGNLIEMIDDASDKDLDSLTEEDFDEDSAPIKSLLNKVVTQAVEMGTSDIHVEPFEHQLIIRYRVDGMLRKGAGPFPPKAGTPISSRIKVMAGLDISETRNPQDGKFRMSLKGKIVDVRVSTCPVNWGEKIVMRILDQSGNRLRLNDLGIDKENLDLLNDGLHSPNGILLVTGPTGSGKTTTLYSALVSLNKPSVNIQTAEDPVEYDLPGISQAQCIPEIGMTFAKVLKAFLRQDPDIILIGEIRDTETAQIALKAALTGHLVLSTLHTNSAVESCGRLLNMGIDRFLISSAVRVILAQRLMRRLCEKCKAPYRPGNKELEEMGITDRLMNFHSMKDFDIKSLTLYKPVGCRECGGSGFKGRMGIHEVMKMTTSMAEGIIREMSTLDLKKVARKDGMMSLRDCAMTRVIRGMSAVSEADRLTVNEEKVALTAGDDDLIDEILIRSGTWKLGPKDLLSRKKQGKYIPGAKGKLGSFFILNDVYEVERQLAEMEDGPDASPSASGNMIAPKVLNDLLMELKGLEAKIEGKTGGETSTASSGSDALMLKNAMKQMKLLDKVPDEKLRGRLRKTLSRLDEGILAMNWASNCPPLEMKKLPLNAAISKDFYAKMPQIAQALGAKTGQKIDLSKIKFSKELDETKFVLNADWAVLKQALIMVLENHLEALSEAGGGALKVKSRVFEQNKKPALELIFHDVNSTVETSHGDEVIAPGFTTKKGRFGYGLAAAKTILSAHGASLSVQIVAKKGCRSKITFQG
ncbi:MAG: Flp pilus assembly complex ATPase component TadA [Candidatus Cloacimonetes bacterium]|nr:Flp pilus assembly complex ATPase component TadA [Candidatus Cloacimonadota bacterium]